ncbi:MAG: hypothetical protein ACFBSE_20590 [Prochloraceae cyanobacterium]
MPRKTKSERINEAYQKSLKEHNLKNKKLEAHLEYLTITSALLSLSSRPGCNLHLQHQELAMDEIRRLGAEIKSRTQTVLGERVKTEFQPELDRPSYEKMKVQLEDVLSEADRIERNYKGSENFPYFLPEWNADVESELKDIRSLIAKLDDDYSSLEYGKPKEEKRDYSIEEMKEKYERDYEEIQRSQALRVEKQQRMQMIKEANRLRLENSK